MVMTSYGGSGGGGRIQPLYAAVIQHACGSTDLDEMKAVAARAEEHLAAEGDIAGQLAALKSAISKLESGQG
jgi:hypothetical protein